MLAIHSSSILNTAFVSKLTGTSLTLPPKEIHQLLLKINKINSHVIRVSGGFPPPAPIKQYLKAFLSAKQITAYLQQIPFRI